MSDGRRSLVNWMRRNVPPSEAASARASVVLPTPGMSSIRRCPRDSSVTTAARIASGLPWMTVAIESSSLRTAPMSFDESGAGAVTAGMFYEYSLETPPTAPHIGPRLPPVAELHHELEHVPEQRRHRREQHQRRRDVVGGWEVAHHEAGLIEDVARHQHDHQPAEDRA